MPNEYSFVYELALNTDQISDGSSDLDTHAGDFASPPDIETHPDVVIYPESTADVAEVVSAAAEHSVPVTPYAAATNLRRGAVPLYGGISLDLTRMDSIIDIRSDDLQVDVQPGVIGGELNEALEQHGLFLPSMPTSGDISTIGGMISTDASGMKTVKYGEVHDWVLELEIVLADGSVITMGSKAPKTSSGYNLMDLFVGSEGTLGIITRATMAIEGLPAQIRAGRATFPTLEDATTAIADAIQSGVDVATIELLDETTAKIANSYTGTALPDKPMVFLEFHANHGIETEIEYCQSIFAAHDVQQFEIAENEADMDQLWEARHDLAYAIGQYNESLTSVGPGDIVVPISQYPTLIRLGQQLAADGGFESYWFGHAGDGNVHGAFLVDEHDSAAIEQAKEYVDEIISWVLEVGGTITGEHGIGFHPKQAALEREHGARSVDVMRVIKEALDPGGILNPGKVVPDGPIPAGFDPKSLPEQ